MDIIHELLVEVRDSRVLFFVMVRDVISKETPLETYEDNETSKLKNEYGVQGLVICLNQDWNFHHSLKTKKHTCINEQRRQLQTTAFDKTPSKNRADAPHSCTVLKTKLAIKSIALGPKEGCNDDRLNNSAYKRHRVQHFYSPAKLNQTTTV